MRYLSGFLGVCALGVVLLVGCGDTNVTVYCGTGGTGVTGGTGGTDGAGGTGGSGGTGGTGGIVGDAFPCTEQGIRSAIARGGGPHTFACNGPTTVVTQVEIAINNDVILDGGGNLTVDGDDSHTVFWVPEGVTAELMRFTITGGGTTPTSQEGSGIRNRGRLTVANSTVSGNMGEQGGGIVNYGTFTLTNSTVSGNTSRTWGGGIVVWARSTLTITNSTVSGNTALEEDPVGGGGILNSGTATITNSTVSGNIADRGGSAIATFEESLTLTNTLIEGDCSIDPPLEFPGEVFSNGGNLESPGNTCELTHATDQVSVSSDNLKLGPLSDNGGPTQTHALLPDSAAIDAIPEAMCEVGIDQRGVTRPQGDACDVGAFEMQP